MTLMLSHSKLTSSRVLPTLCYLKKKLKRDETDSEQLIQIKLLLSACLNFYTDKYKPFNNVFLIAATFLDPWTKDFEFSRNLCDTKPYELIEKAKHFLIKRDKDINPHTTKKNSNEKKEHSIRKKDKVDSVEDEFNSFCGRAKDVAEEFDISSTNLEREIEFMRLLNLRLKCIDQSFGEKTN
jgi:hypothetical protein